MRTLFAILAALIVVPSAHADITDRNLTLTGNAVIAGTVTIQGSPGGANFALTLSSGLTLTNGGVRLNTGGYLQWADGTISTTAGMAAAGGNVPGGNAGGDLAGTYPNPTLAANRVKTTGDAMTGPLTLSGSTLTITGNAFSVGGSTLFVSGGQIGVSTPSPQATLDVNGSAQFGLGATRSTFTAAGLLKLTPSGIQWADGSTSTTASSGGGVSSFAKFASSYTVINEANGSNTTCAGAAVSTVTFTTGGGNIQCEVNATLSSSGSYPITKLCVLVDGAWPTTEEGTVLSAAQPAGAGQYSVGSTMDSGPPRMKVFKNISAGSHTFALFAANDNGTWYLRPLVLIPSWGCWEKGR